MSRRFGQAQTMSDERPEVQPGEAKLVAFVSSVMRPELQWARDAVVSALTSNPVLTPWAFEFTPASSDGAEETYLAKVREASVVIWLVGETTTEPVRNEIAEALAAEKRLWVFRLPAQQRDQLTDELVREVRQGAKSADAADADELRRLLTLTFSDEIIRVFRDEPTLTRLAGLEQLGRASRERMVARWQAAGLSGPEAITFADDLAVGAAPDEVTPTAEHPLSVIVGDVGAGKSVVAERLLQQAIRVSREKASAPVPVFLRARDTTSGLAAALLQTTRGIGDPRQQGMFAVIDGADEIEQSDAAYLIESARVLAHTYPDTRIVITTRPIPALPQEETVELPLLNEDQARELVGRLAGYEITIGAAGGWPSSLADAVRRPLFAILLGLNRRAEHGTPPTTGTLLSALAERAIDPSRAADALPWLQRLGVAATDTGDAPVRVSEIGDIASRVAVAESRVVQIEEGHVRFALPILTQWFAAQSLQAGTPTIEELLGDRRRLDRWRYALAIAVATGPRAYVDETLGVLSRNDPGFAARVVEESLARWAADASPPAESADAIAVGKELRVALIAWGEGTEPLSERLLPRVNDATLAPLAIAAEKRWLTWGWYVGGELDGLAQRHTREIVELPDDINILGGPYAEWTLCRGGRWANEPGWAWRWGLEELRGGVAAALGTRGLAVESERLIDEALWVLALKVARRGSLSFEPVKLDDVKQAIAAAPGDLVLRLDDRYASIGELRSRLDALRAEGESYVRLPWPGPDCERSRGGWIWNPYSPERQRERVEAVYAAALHCYTLIVERWLPRLAPRLRTAAMLPAVLHGTFQASETTDSGCPTISWHLEPLPPGETTRVEIEIGPIPARTRDDYDRDHDRLLRLRPQAAGWISTVYHNGVADVFQGAPLAPLVYGWIDGDLRDTGWGR
jgi:hypothetical protein